jgi:hypothetical protein
VGLPETVVNKQSSAVELFCKECAKFETCSDCGKDFCKENDSLVDCNECLMKSFVFGKQGKDCHACCGQERGAKRAKPVAPSSSRKKCKRVQSS